MSGQGDANEEARQQQRDRLSRLVNVQAPAAADTASTVSIPRSTVGEANQELTVRPRGGQASNWMGGWGGLDQQQQQLQQQLQPWQQQQQQPMLFMPGQNATVVYGGTVINKTVHVNTTLPRKFASQQTIQKAQSGTGGKGKGNAVLQPQPEGVTKKPSKAQRRRAAKVRSRQRRSQNSPAGQAQAQGENQGNVAADDDAQANALGDRVPDDATLAAVPTTAAVVAAAPPPPRPAMPIWPENRRSFLHTLLQLARHGSRDLVDDDQRKAYGTVVAWYARRIVQQYDSDDPAYKDLEEQALKVQQDVVQWCWMKGMWSAEFNAYDDAVHASS